MDSDLNAKGLRIIAYPCNQFGGQEPGTPKEIDEFARGKYGAKFPITEKIDVKGDKAHPLYTHLKDNSALQGKDLPWNFCKFLFNVSTQEIKYFDPKTEPNKMLPDIESILK